MRLLQYILGMFAEKDVKFFKDGNQWMSKGEFLKASYDFKEAISLKPTEEKYHDAIGQSLYKRGMIFEAEKAFAVADDLKLIAKDPRDIAALCRLARAFQERRMFGVARHYINRGAALEPDNDQIHFLLGRANVLANKSGDAVHDFQKAIELSAYCVEAYQALGDIYRIQGKRAKSGEYEALARQIAKTKQSPQDAQTHVELGDVFHKYKRNALAETEYKEALRLEEKTVGAFVGLGILQFEGGENAAAIDNFLKAVEIEKYHSLAHGYLGLLYKEDPKTQKKAEWETALARQLAPLEKITLPEKACEGYMRLGDFFLSHKRTDEAEDAYLRAIQFNAKNPEACVRIALLYSGKKDFKQALNYCNHAIKLAPKKDIGYVGKGRVLLETGDYEKAITLFQESLQYAPNASETHGFLAEAYKKKGLLKLAEREEKIVDAIKARDAEVF